MRVVFVGLCRLLSYYVIADHPCHSAHPPQASGAHRLVNNTETQNIIAQQSTLITTWEKMFVKWKEIKEGKQINCLIKGPSKEVLYSS